MLVVVAFGVGGFDPSKVNDNAVDWADTEARVRHLVVGGVDRPRPFNEAENATVDARGRAGRDADVVKSGIVDLTNAANAAQADKAAAQALQQAANTLKGQADVLAAATLLPETKSLAQGVSQLAQGVSQLAGWRQSVDALILMLAADVVYLAKQQEG